MTKLIKYLKPYSLPLFVMVVFTSIQVWSNLTLPDYTSDIVNFGIMQRDTGYVLSSGGMMLIIALIGGLATIAAAYFATRSASGFSRDLRSKVYERVMMFSKKEYDNFSTASLITRSNNDIKVIQDTYTMLFRLGTMAPLMAVYGSYKAFTTSLDMSWVIFGAVATIIVLVAFLFIFAVPRFKTLQKLTDRLNLVTREFLTGLLVVRAFGNEQVEEKKFDKANDDYTKTNLFIGRLMAMLQPAMTFIMNISVVLIVLIGAYLADSTPTMLGDIFAFMSYSMTIIMAFLMLTMLLIMVPRAAVASTRVHEILVTDPSIKYKEKTDTSNMKNTKGLVEFKNVTFNYGEDPAICDISFTATPGTTTAIIGSTGSGKSTLVNLIPRLYDVTSGEILIDGVNVKDYSQCDLVSKVSASLQKTVLFKGNIKENIAFGLDEVDMDTVSSAAKTAQATEFINDTEGGFDGEIAQGGTNLSGGQKQRVSIARTIAKKSDIYIFDDSFSALDFKTDAKLRAALSSYIADATLIIVAQRIGTIKNADQIIVLDDGAIVGIGKHDELLETCEVYKETFDSQMGGNQ